MFEFEEDLGFNAKIKVLGVGGGGCNALQTMIREKIDGVDFVIVNTDLQALRIHEATVKIQIGHQLTKGLGSGANPEIGRNAAVEDIATIQEALRGTDMVFITVGMGGGTGTGAAPVIAKAAKDLGILTVGVVTKPFSFEGSRRMRQAEAGIKALKDQVDTLICIPNDNLLTLVGKDTPILDSFKMIDYVLLQAVRGISDLITTPGLINLDFADIKTIISDAGVALMGTGIASGENRAIEAAKLAITSPLLEDMSIAGATGILLNITGSQGMTLFEVNEASKLIQQECHEDANIIFGTVVDQTMNEEIRVTVIATGFGEKHLNKGKKEDKTLNQNPNTKKWFDFEKTRESFSNEKPARSATPEIINPSYEEDGHENFFEKSVESIRDVFDDMPEENEKPIKELVPSRQRPVETSKKPMMTELFHPESLSVSLDGVISSSSEKPPMWGESALTAKPPQQQNTTYNGSQTVGAQTSVSRKPVGTEKKRMIPDMPYKDHLDSDEYDIPAFIRKRAD